MKRILLLAIAALFTISLNAQIFSDDFEDDDISDWTTVSPNYAVNPYSWHCYYWESGDQHYLSVSAYDGSTDTEATCWIVSPSFSTVGFSSVDITFDNRARYNIYQDLELYVSTDFAGDSASFDAATWTQVTGFDVDESYDDYDWVVGANANLGSVTGEDDVYIAFKYVSIDGQGGNWTVDNVVITGTSSVNTISKLVQIYPNPATSSLNVNSVSNIENIVVTNVIGQRVFNVNNIQTSNYTIDVADLANGVYLITVENTDGTSVLTKFVKK
jgi:hypothetical protein